MVLGLVFGIFLMLIGVTATALVTVTTWHLTSATLDAVISRDRSLVALFVDTNLQRSDLTGVVSDERIAQLEDRLAALTAQDDILLVELRSADGTILASSAPNQRGSRPPASAGMQEALNGEHVSWLEPVTDPQYGAKPG